MNLDVLAGLTDEDLLRRVELLAQNERRATAALVAHLAEVERRRLYLEQGCASLFTYCRQILFFAEHAAYNRIVAARAALRFPALIGALERGDLHVTAVRLLTPLLTAENHQDLIAAARHKGRRELERMIAGMRPQPDAPEQIRRLPARSQPVATPSPGPAMPEGAATEEAQPHGAEVPSATQPQPHRAEASGAAQSQPHGAVTSGAVQPPPHGAVTAGAAQSPPHGAVTAGAAMPETAAAWASEGTKPEMPGASPRRAAVIPLSEQRYKVQFTASEATRDKLRRAQDLLQHRMHGADLAAIIDLALDLLVRELERSKFAATERPQGRTPPAGSASGGSRHIPAEVRRAVWHRDQGRCTFVSANGRRCEERGQLEFDHILPHADGGVARADNLRLLCRAHNQHEARMFFGKWADDGPPQCRAP